MLSLGAANGAITSTAAGLCRCEMEKEGLCGCEATAKNPRTRAKPGITGRVPPKAGAGKENRHAATKETPEEDRKRDDGVGTAVSVASEGECGRCCDFETASGEKL